MEWFTDEIEAVFRGFSSFISVTKCLFGRKRSEIVFFDVSTLLERSGVRKTVQTPPKAKNDRFSRQNGKIVVRSYKSPKSGGEYFCIHRLDGSSYVRFPKPIPSFKNTFPKSLREEKRVKSSNKW